MNAKSSSGKATVKRNDNDRATTRRTPQRRLDANRGGGNQGYDAG
jgi:hypothetical protein